MSVRLSAKLGEGLAFGEKLRMRRKELNLTQSQVAAVVGCTAQQIQKYEVGKSVLTIPIFLKLCQILRTHPNRFFTGYTFSEDDDIDGYNMDLGKKLLIAFSSVNNRKIKERIVNLVEALISESQ